jgi:hypothetical protein
MSEEGFVAGLGFSYLGWLYSAIQEDSLHPTHKEFYQKTSNVRTQSVTGTFLPSLASVYLFHWSFHATCSYLHTEDIFLVFFSFLCSARY